MVSNNSAGGGSEPRTGSYLWRNCCNGHSRSAGPGTRKNIDEFTRTTAKGIEVCGGAHTGKAILLIRRAPLVRDGALPDKRGP